MAYEPVIGLEIHAELHTKTKMFCNSPNDPDERHPNVNICPVCTAHPGTLPVINHEAVKHVLRIGYALHGTIASVSKFDRKNYFYPDLPKGYQISQYDMPLVSSGSLAISGRTVRIHRIHLEEDTGRLQHAPGGDCSLVDYNRAGIPLMELVTEPDIHSGAEARKFCEEFQLVLRYLGASNANMEKGEMRCEVNISLSCTGSRELGTKVEIKNLNSFRAVERGIDYEIIRQKKLLEDGKAIIQETRGWNEARQETFSQRVKEEAHDYRYFPEPDLPPLRLEMPVFNLIEIEKSLPELPAAKRERFEKEFGLPPKDSEVLVRDKAFAGYYEAVVSEFVRWARDEKARGKVDEKALARTAANYCLTELQKLLYGSGEQIEYIKITPENFAELIKMITKKEISSSAAQTILAEMFHTGGDPSTIAQNKNLLQVSDAVTLADAVMVVIEKNPKPVEDFKKGKDSALQFLTGQVMKETRGSANPEQVQKLLREKLS